MSGMIRASLGGLLDSLLGRTAAREQGRAEQKAVQEAEAAKVGERVRAAEAEPHGRDVTEKRLDSGKF